MPIPTEPIGSLPRTTELLAALADYDQGKITLEVLEAHQDRACQESIDRLVAAGETIVTDGEQRIPSFATYPLYECVDLCAGWNRIRKESSRRCEKDIRQAFKAGATRVSINCTELRLSLKLDPSGSILSDFVSLNNQVLGRFSDDERKNIGIHTCPGSDQGSTHSLDVDYSGLLPKLFEMDRLYGTMGSHIGPEQVIFIGVTDPCDQRVETAEEVRDRLLEAARYLPVDRLGATDDCGFSPFCDDTSISREIAFAKIAARIKGARIASDALGF
ncbi:unnamed protein product [Rhizoctonia solani]|uniref:Cobalamin-independent methionine synthase MetE C-terminal/archaeal domain-containing protein n=1 Tax=Rhizoctonia solani TaxID=456999 RepID=A0A8H2WYA8_9AGAM|nr:unnamed protein product [Rhizoctonia solani]